MKRNLILTLISVVTILLSPYLLADAKYTVADINNITEKDLLPMLQEKPFGIVQPISNRPWWDAAKTKEDKEKLFTMVLKLEQNYKPDFSDGAWLEESARSRYRNSLADGTILLSRLTIAECLENKGRFLPKINELIEMFAGLKTWVPIYHDKKHYAFDGKGKFSDLYSTDLGRFLAQADYLLGDKLTSESREKIRKSVNEWLFEPYKASITSGKPVYGMGWMDGISNWNAVCTSNTIATASVLIDSREERAIFFAQAIRSMCKYLSGFQDDGFCVEGLSYYNFGFEHYLHFAEIIYRQTEGKVDFFNGTEKIENIKLFTAHYEMGSCLFPAFSDCGLRENAQRTSLAIIDIRSKRENYIKYWAVNQSSYAWSNSIWELWYVALRKEASSTYREKNHGNQTVEYETSHYFKNSGVVISRAKEDDKSCFSLAFKGSHNNECHNHNDVGSYVIGLNGIPVITDPGCSEYTWDTFGSSKRYDNKIINSYGHPVPVVDGKLQGTGEKYSGTIIRTDFGENKDFALMDIKAAYPEECGLKKLERTFVHDRDAPSITISDEVEFDKARSFGAAVITYGKIKEQEPGIYIIEDSPSTVKVVFSGTGGKLKFTKELLIGSRARTQLFRLGYDFEQPISTGKITVKITPITI